MIVSLAKKLKVAKGFDRYPDVPCFASDTAPFQARRGFGLNLYFMF
jgi:hypothetical protein